MVISLVAVIQWTDTATRAARSAEARLVHASRAGRLRPHLRPSSRLVYATRASLALEDEAGDKGKRDSTQASEM